MKLVLAFVLGNRGVFAEYLGRLLPYVAAHG
jgi:hypothetical protein